MRKVDSFLALSLVSVLLISCSNYTPVGDLNARPASWTEQTHGNNVTPDYNSVFPDNKVNRIDVTIDPKDWKLMQENMQELFGSGSSGIRMPGNNQPPGFNRGNAMPQPSVSPGASAVPVPRMVPPDGFGGTMPNRPPGGGGGAIQFSEENPIYRPCTLKFEGKTWNHVGIRYKGNSSLKSSWGRTLKMPFRFDFDEFETDYPAIKNQRFFGFKKLSLSSGFTDNSLIREKVVADIFRDAGVPAAQTAFYRVYVNYGEGEKYFGLYTMVEVPDTPMLQAQFKKPEGNLYKPEGNGAKFVTFDEKSFEKKTNETNSDWNDIKAIFTALHNSRENPEQWRNGLEKVLDVKGFLKYLAVNTTIQNWDTYGAMAHNYFLYNDPGDGLVHWIPWDNNMALSGGMGGGGIRSRFDNGLNPMPPNNTMPGVPPFPPANELPSPQADGTPNLLPVPGGMGRGNTSLDLTSVDKSWPLIRYLMDDPVYKAQYIVFVEETIKGAFDIEKNKSRYQKEHDLIAKFVVGTDGEKEESTLLESKEAFEKSVEELTKHLEERHTSANKFIQENQK